MVNKMKNMLLIILLLLTNNSNAFEKVEKQCIKNALYQWSDLFVEYWKQIDVEFKKEDDEIYREFSYLIKEQLNNDAMKRITLNYLLENRPGEIRVKEKVYRLVPHYLNYQNEIHRELRKIKEFDQLFKENYSYKHDVKNPAYDRLRKASQIVADIQKRPSFQKIGEKVMEKGGIKLTEMKCTTLKEKNNVHRAN